MAEITDLPIHVLILILLPFPAKLLTQFKTVCKLWSQIISSPDFINLHFDRTLTLTPSENPNRRFVFSCHYLYSSDFDTFDNITELDHPFRKIGRGFVQVAGSCHGLLCLHNYPSDQSIYLYNPTNRTHKKLPFLSTPKFPYSYYFGFGYDCESGDFKFVRILTTSDELINENEPLWSEVMVYSLRADSWTSVRDSTPPRLSPRHKEAFFFGGNLHWVVSGLDAENVHNSIVGFNLSDYKFNQVAHPPYERELVAFRIGMLDACLCVVANVLTGTDVWVMKEYGVVGTWTRLYTIKHGLARHFDWPIAFSVDRRTLFLQSNYCRVVSLDLETMEVKEVKVSDLGGCYDTHVCVENLMVLKNDHGRRRKRKGGMRRHRRMPGRARQHQEVQDN